MTDILSGRYSQQSPWWSVFGMQNNLAQPNRPADTSLPPYPGLAGLFAEEAPIVTKEETTFPAWIEWGKTIEKFSFCLGATAIETLTHAWIAVRTGAGCTAGGSGAAGEIKPVLVAESADETGLTGAKTTTWSISLKKPLLITPENAPFGYVYVSVFATATKVGTYVAFKTQLAALNKVASGLKVFPWFPNVPIYSKSKPASETTPEKEPKEVVLVEIAPFCLIQ